MKKQYWVLVIILIVLVLGYLGRDRIKTLLMGSPKPIQTITTPVSSEPPTATTSANIVTTRSNGTKGSFIADPNGRTLYIFDKDKPGVSNCSGSCAALWPPYTTISPSTDLPSNVGLIKQTEGISQYTYKDMPLYYYAQDKQPGDVLGDGVNGAWHLVKP